MTMQGKVVVVTGGSMGIGEAVARLFHEKGAMVAITSRELARAEEARERLGGGDRLLALAADVRDPVQARGSVEQVLARCGRVDVWVNNAGHGLNDSIANMDMAACRSMFETNLFGAIECMQAVIPVMKRHGGGAIINISSVAGHIAVPYMAAYGATKFALNAVSRGARMELARDNIHVITVCPGYINTDFAKNAVKGKDRLRLSAAAKIGITADRVAEAVWRAYRGNKREVVVPWRDRVIIKLYQLMPRLIDYGMGRMLRPTDQVIAEAEAAQK